MTGKQKSQKEQNKKLIEQIQNSISDLDQQIEKEKNRTENFDRSIQDTNIALKSGAESRTYLFTGLLFWLNSVLLMTPIPH